MFSGDQVSASINIERTGRNGSSLDPLGRRDLLLKDGILLATPQVSGPLPMRIAHSPAPGRIGGGQVESQESNNNQIPSLELSNSRTAYVSKPEQESCRIGTVTVKENVFLQSLGAEAKAVICQGSPPIPVQHVQPYCKQTDNADASSSSEPETESDVAGGRLLGAFDNEDLQMQESA
jgi:hypothetical protein